VIEGNDADPGPFDALFQRPSSPRALRAWIDARLGSGRREDALLAAKALGAMRSVDSQSRLRLGASDIGVRRVALLSWRDARIHAPRALLRTFSTRARPLARAVAALGSVAVPPCGALITGPACRPSRRGARGHRDAARGRAAQSRDVRLRHLPLRSLTHCA
jgi:hypothetical protein